MTPLQFTRNVRSLNRLRQIAQVLTRHGFGFFVAQINMTRFLPVWMLGPKARRRSESDEAAAIGRRLAKVAVELGPTFIKLGQMLSTRPDIVPHEVIAGLQTLQDDVPPFDTSEAMAIIVRELGQPLEDLFIEIDEQPFACASIGQVYRARTPDGQSVVVKVRRPGIEQVTRLDMQLLRWLAESAQSLLPELRVYRPVMLVDELNQALRRELDYVHEASTTVRFAHAFKDEPDILVPTVLWELTSPQVLTLTELPGVNMGALLERLEGEELMLDRAATARRLAECFLTQVFELGEFHADPHPGNILLHPPSTIGLIDYGQVGTLSDELMGDLAVMVYGAVHGELNLVVETLADMGTTSRTTDLEQLKRSLGLLFGKYDGLPLKRLDLDTLFNEFTDLIRCNDLAIPRDMALLIKSLGILATVTSQLDPELNLLELIEPRIRKSLKEQFSAGNVTRSTALLGWDVLQILRRAPGRLRSALRRLSMNGLELTVRHEGINRLTRELDRSSNRLAFSIVIAGIIVGSSVVITSGSGIQVLGLDVKYVGVLGYLIAGVMGLSLSWAIFRSGRLH